MLFVKNYTAKISNIFITTKYYLLIYVKKRTMILLLQENIPNKKIYINEKQENILKEALTDIVYHFTNLPSALSIVKNDTIYLQSVLGSDAENMKTKELFFLSTTRQKSIEFGYSQRFKDNGVRFTLDGELLKQNFKGKAVNYWGELMGKHSYYNGNHDFQSKQHHTDNESEDRLFSTSPKIEQASKYIKRIDIVINKDNKHQLIYAQNIYLSKFSNKVFIYDNNKDFDYQTDNTINKEILNNMDLNDFQNKELFTSSFSSEDLGKIILMLLIGEVDNKKLNEEAAKLAKQYNFERYINRDFFKGVNYYWSIEQLISEVKDKLFNFSKHPNELTNRVLSMINDYFKKHKISNFKQLIQYKISLGVNTSYKDEDLYDINKTITTYVWKKNSFDKYIIPDINKVPFKTVIDDIETFAENLEFYARDNYTSKNDFHFVQYIKSIINKNISIKGMYSIMKKLNLTNEDIESLMNYKPIEIVQISPYDYYNYKFLDEPEDMNTYRNIQHQRRFMNMFKK